MPGFSTALISWQREHGRHNLPWQTGNPYHVWLSEIMLQQTQVATVIPYYLRFIASYPTIAELASSSEEQVLSHWSGLGYYARGRNLYRAAKMVASVHDGIFPNQYEQILALPGIGRSTAAAICAQAYHQPYAILDGNVKRVLARYCGISGATSIKSVEQLLWRQADALLPQHDVAVYTQALMDMGATLCTRSRPKCGLCPVQGDCAALQSGRVAELPTPRLRKMLPERYATFLLVMEGGDILLEKRGDSGIWGGLWCLPQLNQGELEEYLQLSGWAVKEQATLPAFTHAFTHFKLHIAPLRLTLSHKPAQPAMWMNISEALDAAIPTPVRLLLESVLRDEAFITA